MVEDADARASGAQSRGSSHFPAKDDAAELKALEHRATALEREGRLEDASVAYEEVFSRAAATGTITWIVDSLRWQCWVRGRQRRFEEAEELGELSGILARAHGMGRAAARALNLLGIFRHEQGDLEGAHKRYSAALDEAREIGDDHLVGFICQNLGVYANMQGDLRGARVLYLESIAGTLTSEDETNLTMAYNNLGMVCTDLQEWVEAEVYFDRGVELARRLDDRGQLARLCANRAEPMIRTGELTRGRASLDEAERHAEACGAQSTLATIATLRAMAARLEGDLDEAELHVQTAVGFARDEKLLLAEAEALHELARLRYAQDRLAEAHSEALAARALFRQLGAARDAAEVNLLLKEWEEGAQV